MQPQIQDEIKLKLLKIFQTSQLYQFFKFLKSKKAKHIIQINPNDDQSNPKTFYFQIPKLRKASPELARCLTHLIPFLQRSGMTSRRVVRENFKRSKFTSVTHEKLTLNSTKQEIMEVWLKAETAHFLKSNSIIMKIYGALHSGNRYVSWNDNGSGINVSSRWEFYTLKFTDLVQKHKFNTSHYPEIRHPYLRRDSPITTWLLIFLTEFKERIRERLAFKEKKAMMMVTQPEKQLMALSTSKQHQEQDQKQSIYPKQSQKQFTEMRQQFDSLSKNYKLLQQPTAFTKKCLFNCLVQTVNCKISEMKSLIALVQKNNIELQLSPIFIWLEEIMLCESDGKRQNQRCQKASKSESEMESKLAKFIEKMKERMDKIEHQNKMLRQQLQNDIFKTLI